jgi:hypothetical protein
MMMPSAVRLERSLLRRNARSAMNKVCHDWIKKTWKVVNMVS